MVALHKALLACALLGADGFRARNKHAKRTVSDARKPTAKIIAGVPVLNYERAYGGAAVVSDNLDERSQDWIVVMSGDSTDAEIEALCQRGAGSCKMMGHPSRGGVPFFELHGTEKDLESVLEAADGALFVEPNLRIYRLPDKEDNGVQEADPESTPWGLKRVGAETRPRLGKGVHVHILDTGILMTHDDFGGRAMGTMDYTGFGDPSCEGKGLCAGDLDGHGSHCAGTAAGTKYGVAPEATLHSVKVIGRGGFAELAWITGAVDWMAVNAQRPAVASMSLGGPGNVASMRTAIDTAVQAGVTVVVAGGNEENDACKFSPSYIASAITVGSTTVNDKRSFFSNFGKCTNIWAPGSNIRSAGHSTNDATRQMSGTSMACPHVAGAAALLMEASPAMTPSQILERLHADGQTNVISELFFGDTNKFLWVGAAPAPPTPTVAPPTEPPSTACPMRSTGPDSDGDCACNAGWTCYEGPWPGCKHSRYADTKVYSQTYFLQTCKDCECQ